MIYLKAILLAIVEGVTEFLPVSSTGHLILVEGFIQLSDDAEFNRAFMILIQFPAILSVVVYFWQDIWPFSGSSDQRAERLRLWKVIAIAVVPILIVGALLNDAIDKIFFAPIPVTVALLAGGIVLIVMERVLKRGEIDSLVAVSKSKALGIGLFQCMALFPGTSRSGATIFGAMVLGIDRKTAAAFSFILAIPTMAAATAYQLLNSGFGFTGEQWGVLVVGSLVSFGVSYVSISLLMNYVQHHSFAAFGWYRVVLGIAMFIMIAIGALA
ncbi:MAG: undecaprenyl-diphosphate phosphatase [Candidatus Hydrogenedentota bacterium]